LKGLNSILADTIRDLEQEFDLIPEDRQLLLNDLTTYIKGQKSKPSINLTFICTHNSRRSHIAQIWAQAAAFHYGIKGLKAYSGGTEVTAFHPNAVHAMEQVGFQIRKKKTGKNPRYKVRYAETEKSIPAFSKLYNESSNPQSEFAAIMTCSSASEACPIVEGANFRIPITYNDPKEFDDTPMAEEKYLERVLEIGREMLYVFSRV